jgi:hypothetical protein
MPTFFTKICEQCNIEYSVVPRYKKKKFCSAICYKTHSKLNAKHPRQGRCLNCKSDLIKKSSMKFCSQSCAAQYNNNHRSHETHKKQSNSLRETLLRRGLSRTDAKEIYKIECKFQFNIYQYPNILGYDLLLERGMYNHHTNKEGVVRDHIISKEYGWQYNIPTEIIQHPANCQFITNQENIKKSSDSHLSLQDLMVRIETWNEITQSIPHNRKTIIRVPPQQRPRKTTKVKPVPVVPLNPEKYQWTLHDVVTGETEITTNITSWLKSKHLSTAAIYGRKPKWIVITKTSLKQERLFGSR